MALYRYFKLADNVLPSPIGDDASSVSPATIRAANEAVNESAITPFSKSRGAYAKYTPLQQAKICDFTSVHGNLAAVRHFVIFSTVIDTCQLARSRRRRDYMAWISACHIRGMVNSGHAKRENFFWRPNGTFAEIWIRENFPVYGITSSLIKPMLALINRLNIHYLHSKEDWDEGSLISLDYQHFQECLVKY